ncbi:hypothetical protein BDB00DRAFT_608756 [Zychaea mexicana]|uniref:uncharacterized protein n=1 Tax=Zychaea mexicana TaxID=64656 RepID=UPI0022FE588E|nr:uncharacterized protein BDB00DRAFT_608756 [Zychaea mexicana]KAI9489558.1 hypothetical protein BDB00DRAFT_608756 [Zychaea mexicana]
MKRILNSSSGSNSNSSSNNKRSKITFDIQLDQRKYYFRGDVVEGRIYLESPKPIKVKNIRVQWFGRVRVQLEPSLRDERELFRETAYLDLPETENATETARREALKKAATTTTAYGIMIPPSPSKGSHYVEVDKLYTYPFSLVIPQNTILPSCTEVNGCFSREYEFKKSETSVGGIVEYIIEACLERPTSDFAASIKTQILVPVLQRIETTRPEQVVPQSVQVESQGPFSQCRGEGTATLTASVPKEAFVRNLPVPVTIEIKHFEPFQRKQGLMIALIRTCRIVCKGA